MALRRRGGRRASLREHVGYFDLLADLKRKGCPVCHGAHRAAWRYLDSLLWEHVNDPGIRSVLRTCFGFCREHSTMAISVARHQAAGLGMAILYEDFLRTADRRLQEAVRERARGRSRRLRGVRLPSLPRPTPCRACATARQVEENALHLLATAPDESEIAIGMRQTGRGLCLPHVLLGLHRARTEEQADRLLAHFVRGDAELRVDLQAFIRKQDYRFRGEGLTEAEASAWRRAVLRLVGEPTPRAEPPR